MVKTSRKGSWYEIVVPEEWTSFTLDQLLRHIWKAPKKMIHSLRMDQKVLVNGQSPEWNKLFTRGDKLQLRLFEEEESSAVPAYHPIDVLFEDDHLLILNKPAGMDTHPNEPGQTNTLANAAAFHIQSSGETLNVRHVHRLDRDTTGAVLFSKTALAGAILDRMLEERQIKRTYLAITDGLIKKKKGKIIKPIGRDRHHSVRRRVSPTGQKAVTNYEVTRLMREEKKTLVRCSLETGRTHQIRVHFSDMGHPLSGDTLYGGSSSYGRQALHAVKIELFHPFTGEALSCHAPFKDNPEIFHNIDLSTI
ncbi:RluA family pseudouridine synthase [Mesobacillus foraminis]|uniref:RluA family pseudouridine synthase n=1 Tax=Mesobacillus foraminis TaxID=279826 RepID=UPI0039A08129